MHSWMPSQKGTPYATDAVTAYANSVASGKQLACRAVKLAAERHLRDLVEGPNRGLSWHPGLADWYVKFFSMFSHSKGEWAGRRFELESWQKFVIGSVFGWKRDGKRRFRRVYEELPRKNGKSTKLAGVGLALLVADGEPGAEVYAAATKKEQSRIIFDEAKRMVRASPALRKKIRTFQVSLVVPSTNSKFEPLSADEKTLDGLNPSGVLIDEIHKHKSRAVIDVLETALGSRRQPLLWMITTAGDDNPETPYAAENHYAWQVLEGVLEDDTTFVFITTIDKEDRWDDPVAWAKANPNLGVSVNLEYIREQARRAKNVPSALVSFKRLHLNVRTSDATKAIEAATWNANNVEPIDVASLKGRKCYMALDLASKIDLASSIRLFEPLKPGDRWLCIARFWMPADEVEEKSDRDNAPYQRWIDEGWIHPTPGNIIDFATIQAQVLEDAAATPPEDIAVDPWNAYGMIPELQKEGMNVFEFVQGLKSYTAPTKEFLAMLKAKSFDFGFNPVMAWNASNLHIQVDKNDNQMPTKKHSRGRIDGMTATIMAVGRALNTESTTIQQGIVSL